MAPTPFQIGVPTVKRWWEGIDNPQVTPPESAEWMLTAQGSRLWGHNGLQGRAKPDNETARGEWTEPGINKEQLVLLLFKVCFFPK